MRSVVVFLANDGLLGQAKYHKANKGYPDDHPSVVIEHLNAESIFHYFLSH